MNFDAMFLKKTTDKKFYIILMFTLNIVTSIFILVGDSYEM